MNLKQLFTRRNNNSQIEALLAKSNLSRDEVKKTMLSLALRTDYLTKKDVAAWRMAWQRAIDIEHPRRAALYNIYTDSQIDLHLSGAVEQRKNMVLKKSFRLIGKDGKEDRKTTELFETEWFKDFMGLALDSRYWGHSLIELGDKIGNKFASATLVPRKHVMPEYGVILKDVNDEPSQGINYRDGDISMWCIEAGKPKDLGLLLKCAPETISKRHMLSFWDGFGEIFGAPVRVAKTASQDVAEQKRVEKMLSDMGAMSWGLFPEGTEVEFLETSRGDAFNVYDKRINRANSEISKGILNQTMTIDSGSSLSQSEVHLEVFQNVIEQDADFLRDIINDKLIPLMITHGFPVQNFRFDWDDAIDYTPEQMQNIEQMLINAGYEIKPEYFIDKYNIPIIGKKQSEDFFA